MALGLLARIAARFGAALPTVPVSVGSTWQTVHADISSGVAAETAGVLLQPLTATTASIKPLKVGQGVTRMILRTRQPQAIAIATTHPVVQVFGIWGEPTGETSVTAGSWADDGSVKVLRLDSADNTNTGLTMTVTLATDTRDTTYRYSNVKPDLTGIDLKGCDYVMVLVHTAGIITTSSGAIELEALGLN